MTHLLLDDPDFVGDGGNLTESDGLADQVAQQAEYARWNAGKEAASVGLCLRRDKRKKEGDAPNGQRHA